jgi:hypothetical protein
MANWIAGAVKNKGGLHRSLGIPEGQKIGQKRIEKAENSTNERTARQARLAETLSHMRK